MNTRILLKIGTILGSVSLLGACASLPEQRGDGYVADIAASDVRLCFYASAPPPGQEVRIARLVPVHGLPKAPPMSREQGIGTARITAQAADSCALAVMTEGRPRPRDLVHLPSGR